MEKLTNSPVDRKYTMRWLGIQSMIIIGISFILSLIVIAVDDFALHRAKVGFLQNTQYSLISQSISYCFWVIAISSVSLMLIEIKFRKAINNVQYILIALALALFYLLLLAMSEMMPFAVAYIIVSVMTISLITLFVKGITHNKKAISLISIILCVEYCVIFALVNLGAIALLIGSLTLFVLIALSMYFTLKLRLENDELVLKM